jgi:hypothetical protein
MQRTNVVAEDGAGNQPPCRDACHDRLGERLLVDWVSGVEHELSK